ncbi:MAG: hypothetical protein AB7J35_09425 [Dehalococcoidia bacterium]
MAFGHRIFSDCPLRGLPVAPGLGPASVTMRNTGAAVSVGTLEEGAPRFVREPFRGGIRYVARGIGEFVIAPGGTEVIYTLAAGAPPGDVQHILTGPALVMALQLQGRFILHSGAVECDGAMFAVSAPHGFGKSTLTAAFHRAGYPVCSDDVVPIREHEGSFLGGQGQPWIKLWDNALEHFGDRADAYHEVLHGFGKRIVPGVTTEGELPLRTVYLLAPNMDAGCPTRFRQLTCLEGALSLMASVYSPEIIVRDLATKNLDFATRLANAVPVRVVSYYRSFENLPNICDAILRDFDEVTRA